MKNKFTLLKFLADFLFYAFSPIELLTTIRRLSLIFMFLGSLTHYLDNRKYAYIILALIWVISSMIIRALKLRANKANKLS